MSQIAVLIPCYNSANYIRRTVLSVLAQTLVTWKMIIVDDGSSDDPEAELIDIIRRDERIRLIKQKNGGVARARNRAYSECGDTCEYILFLDADDTLEPQMLEYMGKYLDDHAEVGMAYCEPKRINGDDEVIAVEAGATMVNSRWMLVDGRVLAIPSTTADTPFESMFAFCSVVPSISLIRRQTYSETPGFDEEFGHLCEDTDVFLEIALRSRVHYMPEHLANYRIHAQQATTLVQ